MAKKEIVFNVRTDTGNSVKDMKELSKSAETVKMRMDEIEDASRNVSKASAESSATENFQKLNAVVDDSVLGWQEMGQAVDVYRNIARQAGLESPVGQEALSKAAALEKEMDQLTTTVAGLSSRGREMQAALQLGTGIVAGYSAFQGVTAMLGVENEKMLETITKLQAAQSTLMGVEQLRMALERDSVLMLQARIVATRAQTAVTNLLSRATAGATASAKAFNIAMSVGIIGAITAAVGLLIANWDKLVSALTPAISKTKEMVEATRAAREQSEAAYEAFGEEERRLRLLGETEKEIATQRREHAAERLQALDKEMAAQEMLLTQTLQGMAQTEGFAAALSRSPFGDSIARFFGTTQEDVAEVQSQLDSLKQMRLKFQNDILEIDKTGTDRAKEALADWAQYEREQEQKQAEAAKQRREQEMQAAKEARELEEQEMMAIRDLRISLLDDELETMKAKHADEREELIAKYGTDTELLVLLEQEQSAQLEEFRRTKREERLAKDRELMDRLRKMEADDAELQRILAEEKFIEDQELLLELREQELISEEEFLMKREELQKRYQDQLDTIQSESAKKQKDIEQMKYKDMAQAAQGYVQSAGSILTNLNKLSANLSADTTKNKEKEAKRQFAIDKAVSIAQATIQGALGIVQTIGSLGFPAAIPFIALSVLTTGAAIAAIASEQFQGGGGSGGGGGGFSAPSMSTPQTGPDTGQGETRTVVDGEEIVENPPQSGGQQQVVVLASDVSDVNNENNEIDAVSTIGGGG